MTDFRYLKDSIFAVKVQYCIKFNIFNTLLIRHTIRSNSESESGFNTLSLSLLLQMACRNNTNVLSWQKLRQSESLRYRKSVIQRHFTRYPTNPHWSQVQTLRSDRCMNLILRRKYNEIEGYILIKCYIEQLFYFHFNN